MLIDGERTQARAARTTAQTQRASNWLQGISIRTTRAAAEPVILSLDRRIRLARRDKSLARYFNGRNGMRCASASDFNYYWPSPSAK